VDRTCEWREHREQALQAALSRHTCRTVAQFTDRAQKVLVKKVSGSLSELICAGQRRSTASALHIKSASSSIPLEWFLASDLLAADVS
jgi:hypothetical protein